MRTYKLKFKYEGETYELKATTNDDRNELTSHKHNENAELNDAFGMWLLQFHTNNKYDVELQATNIENSSNPNNIVIMLWHKDEEYWIDLNNDYTLTINTTMEQVNNTIKSVQLITDYEELRKNLKEEINQFDNLLQRLLYFGNNNIYECINETEKAKAEALRERLVEIQEWAKVWNVLSNGIRSVLSE